MCEGTSFPSLAEAACSSPPSPRYITSRTAPTPSRCITCPSSLQVNCAPFSPDVQSCLPAKGWTIPGEPPRGDKNRRSGGR
eukprot:scaffold5209_cov106-Isochrysis_galbana.AAC.7